MTDLRDRIAEVLYQRAWLAGREKARERAAAVMAVVQPEIDQLKAGLAAQIGVYKSAEEDLAQAVAAIERVRALLDMAIASSWEGTPVGDSVREARAALDQPAEGTP